MEALDAVVLAAGRLPADDASRAGASLKAQLRIGSSTLLESIVAALRASRAVRRVVLVAPLELRDGAPVVDSWVDERPSGEQNVLAALAAARSAHVLLCASDLPFVTGAMIDDFLARVPAGCGFAYPVFTRTEFLAAFPGGRTRFARVGGVEFTGGSVCCADVAVALDHARLVRRGFGARKSQFAMASLLGFGVLARFVTGRLRIEDIERRLDRLAGGRVLAVRGADPALAMDCDGADDVAYARELKK